MSEQLEFAGLPRPLFSATPSRLTSFECPRRYRMTYVDRPPAPKGAPWAHNTVGAVLHVALARWWQLEPSKRTPESGAGLVHRHWQNDGFESAEQSEAWRQQAADWLRQYLGDELERNAGRPEPRGIERTVTARTDVLVVSGRADRIDERDGELVIVDYKSGRTMLTEQDARRSIALAIYALAAEQTLYRRCRRVELHHLPSGTVAGYEHSDESLADQIGRAEELAIGITAALDEAADGADPVEVFPPNPGPACSWCDFRRLCPEGQAASVPRRSWEGLGALVRASS